MPLRAIYRRAVSRGDVTINPTTGLELPAVRGRRERIASPREAEQLLAALDEADRALWAVALYAGLRRGELMALRWEDIELAKGLIRVERAWDPVARVFVEPEEPRRPKERPDRVGPPGVPAGAQTPERTVERVSYSATARGRFTAASYSAGR